MTKIKICGLTRYQDIEAVNECQPDYIGFLFAPERRRTVTAETAGTLKSFLDKNIKAVGVFVNNDIDFVIHLAQKGTIDLIQLHGDETEEYIHFLKQHTNLPIIRAVRVKTAEDILKADTLPVDYLLLDTYAPNAYGGTGKTFDWSMIPSIKKPFFLAGGLRIDNIAQACHSDAYCLDLSSGAETNGVKDKKKIEELIRIVRSE